MLTVTTALVFSCLLAFSSQNELSNSMVPPRPPGNAMGFESKLYKTLREAYVKCLTQIQFGERRCRLPPIQCRKSLALTKIEEA